MLFRRYLRSTFALFLLASAVSLAACGQDGQDAAPSGDTKVLARNVVLRADGVQSLKTSGLRPSNAALDPDLKVTASNVVYQQSETADLSVSNVQEALESLAVQLSSALPGEWDITNVNIDGLISVGKNFSPNGKLRVNADGTFELVSGSFAAIEMVSPASVDVTRPTRVDSLLPRVAKFSFSPYMDETRRSSNPRALIPLLLDARPNRLVFSGPNQSLSFLTRSSTGPQDAGADAR